MLEDKKEPPFHEPDERLSRQVRIIGLVDVLSDASQPAQNRSEAETQLVSEIEDPLVGFHVGKVFKEGKTPSKRYTLPNLSLRLESLVEDLSMPEEELSQEQDFLEVTMKEVERRLLTGHIEMEARAEELAKQSSDLYHIVGPPGFQDTQEQAARMAWSPSAAFWREAYKVNEGDIPAALAALREIERKERETTLLQIREMRLW